MRYIVITPATNPQRCVTHLLFEQAGVDYTVVVNTPEQVALARDLGAPPRRIEVADPQCCDRPVLQGRLPALRNWALANLISKDDYAVIANDNIIDLAMMPLTGDRQDFTTRSSSEWRRLYSTPLGPRGFACLMEEIAQRCSDLGASYGGVGHPAGNYFFCKKRWVELAYIIGDLMVVRNDRQPWVPPEINMWDDWYCTCRSLAESGSVVCCRYASTIRVKTAGSVPVTGSIGPIAARLPYYRQDALTIMKLFPGLVEYHRGLDYCLRLTVRSKGQLDCWRREHGYLFPQEQKQ